MQNSGRTDSEQDKEHRCTRPMRERRRIAGKRSQRNDKYPLAFNLLAAEFKLQRAAGSKVSKLWYKKKRMKLKIEACYDAEEAAKFKGSNNWFQRFKKETQNGTKKDQQEETRPLQLTPSILNGCLKIDTKLILTRFLSHL